MVLGPEISHCWLSCRGIQRLHEVAVDNLRIQASCAFHTPLPVSGGSKAWQGELGFLTPSPLGPEGEWKFYRGCRGPAGSSRCPQSCGQNWVSQLPKARFSECGGKIRRGIVGPGTPVPELQPSVLGGP